VSNIAAALQKSRQIIEAELAEARAELAELDARREELEALIAQAEAVLGGSPAADAEPRLTLHEALVTVLREHDGAAMTARELADAVNERGLYRSRDGSPVEVNQVHARASNYEGLFEKNGSLIQLRTLPAVLADLPSGIMLFRDDDSGFSSWLDGNPEGYFINAERNPGPNYIVLHRSGCPHFSRNPGLHWTKDYIKLCSASRPHLEEWAASAVDGEVTLCRTCFGK
jgi:hypothetical protein